MCAKNVRKSLSMGRECGQGTRVAVFVEHRDKQLLTVLEPALARRTYYYCEAASRR